MLLEKRKIENEGQEFVLKSPSCIRKSECCIEKSVYCEKRMYITLKKVIIAQGEEIKCMSNGTTVV